MFTNTQIYVIITHKFKGECFVTYPAKITATPVQISINPNGVKLYTMELVYPRFILSEVNTHRMLSKNSASSRAIPIKKMVESLNASPVHWGKNQPGMQAKEELTGAQLDLAKSIWLNSRDQAISNSIFMESLGVHKQIANRITEPWMMMKTVISGTEWDNLLWLRNHEDAQPEFHELAKKIQEVLSNPVWKLFELGENEWHVPYVSRKRDSNGVLRYYSNDLELTLEQAKKVSASCCAQVSYRALDESLGKAEMIYDKLITSQPIHASPIEHQATPVITWWQEGVSHIDREGNQWSGNFRDWIQHRKLIPGESKNSLQSTKNVL